MERQSKQVGRVNQKARTRAALVQAAMNLVREGRLPSIPEAAERAQVSVATAYRYFPSADDLWFEASDFAASYEPALLEAEQRIDIAGDDPVDRLEALVRTLGFAMLDDQAPYRRIAKMAHDQWFRQAEIGVDDRAPTRVGRRNQHIAHVIEPLRGRLSDRDVERIAHALGVVVGTDAMLALIEGVGLKADDAKGAMLDAARWLLTGAILELQPAHAGQSPPPSSTKAPTGRKR